MGGCTSQNVPMEEGVMPNNLAEPTLNQNSELKAGEPMPILSVSGHESGAIEPVAKAAPAEPVATAEAPMQAASGAIPPQQASQMMAEIAEPLAKPLVNGLAPVALVADVAAGAAPVVIEADPLPQLQNALGFSAVDANDPQAVAAMQQKVEEFNRQQETAAYSKALSGIVAQGGQNVMVIADNGQEKPMPLAAEQLPQPISQAMPIANEDPERPVETVQEMPVGGYQAVAEPVPIVEPSAEVVAEVQESDAVPEKKKKRFGFF